MFLKRKIDKWLEEWKNRKHKAPALVVGIRQCGKTYSIMHFGEKNYRDIVYINFWDNLEYSLIFEGELDVNTIISNISVNFPDIEIHPEKTLIFLDEIQECPRARLSFKNFQLDGRYDVIGSGSYLGINGYVIGDTTPAPTGYDDVYHMHTLDFEEFLWANNYKSGQIEQLEAFFDRKEPVPGAMHELFKRLFNQYICIGGFPKSVKVFLENRNVMEAFRENQNVIFDMKTDFGRRKGKDGNPVFKPSEVARIQNVFDLIPTFLAKDNKRFVTSKINTGSSSDKVNAIEYLKQAHIVYKVHNLEVPSLPLESNKVTSQFKLFPADIGMVVTMFGAETLAAVSSGDLGFAKGALYEACVFDSFVKSGIETFYFGKNTGLEIDFVICYQRSAYLVEAKTKTGNTKSSKTVMAHPEHYGKTKLLKIGDYNISETGDIITIPHYLTFLIGRKEELIFEDLSWKG